MITQINDWRLPVPYTVCLSKMVEINDKYLSFSTFCTTVSLRTIIYPEILYILRVASNNFLCVNKIQRIIMVFTFSLLKRRLIILLVKHSWNHALLEGMCVLLESILSLSNFFMRRVLPLLQRTNLITT